MMLQEPQKDPLQLTSYHLSNEILREWKSEGNRKEGKITRSMEARKNAGQFSY